MKIILALVLLTLSIKNGLADLKFIQNGQYICNNIESYLMNESFTKKLQVLGLNSSPLQFDISKNSISTTYGPSGFKTTTNYWGKWQNLEAYDMFIAESSEPKSPLNWNMVLIGVKNSPITARKVSKGYRTFQYICSSMKN